MYAMVVWQFNPQLVPFDQYQDTHITSGSGAFPRGFATARASRVVKGRQQSLAVFDEM